MVILENCSNSVASAIEAQKGGAQRIELCDNLAQGGTTPALSTIIQTRKYLDIDIYVLVRPRGGDFCYTDIEFESMKLDIQHAALAGANGVVLGCLTSDAELDIARNKELINIAKQHKLSVSLHRAFDRSNKLFDALEQAIDLGFDRILSSGGKSSALAGKQTLKELAHRANNRIIIMPGAGITEYNLGELVSYTGLKEFHGTFGTSIKGKMNLVNYNKELGTIDNEMYTIQTDSSKIARAISNAKQNK